VRSLQIVHASGHVRCIELIGVVAGRLKSTLYLLNDAQLVVQNAEGYFGGCIEVITYTYTSNRRVGVNIVDCDIALAEACPANIRHILCVCTYYREE